MRGASASQAGSCFFRPPPPRPTSPGVVAHAVGGECPDAAVSGDAQRLVCFNPPPRKESVTRDTPQESVRHALSGRACTTHTLATPLTAVWVSTFPASSIVSSSSSLPLSAPSSLSVAPLSSASVSSCDVPSSLSGTSPVVAGVQRRENKSGSTQRDSRQKLGQSEQFSEPEEGAKEACLYEGGAKIVAAHAFSSDEELSKTCKVPKVVKSVALSPAVALPIHCTRRSARSWFITGAFVPSFRVVRSSSRGVLQNPYFGQFWRRHKKFKNLRARWAASMRSFFLPANRSSRVAGFL